MSQAEGSWEAVAAKREKEINELRESLAQAANAGAELISENEQLKSQLIHSASGRTLDLPNIHVRKSSSQPHEGRSAAPSDVQMFDGTNSAEAATYVRTRLVNHSVSGTHTPMAKKSKTPVRSRTQTLDSMFFERSNLEDQLHEWKRKCEMLEAAVRAKEEQEDEEEEEEPRKLVGKEAEAATVKPARMKSGVSAGSQLRAAAVSDVSDVGRGRSFTDVEEKVRQEVQEDFRDVVDDLQDKLASAEQAKQEMAAQMKEHRESIMKAEAKLTKKEVERDSYKKELAEAKLLIKKQQADFERAVVQRAQKSGLEMEDAEDDVDPDHVPMQKMETMASAMSLHDQMGADDDLAEQNEELMYMVTEQREQLEQLRSQLDQYKSGWVPPAGQALPPSTTLPPNDADAGAGGSSVAVAALREELAATRKEVEEQKALLKQHRLSIRRKSLAQSREVLQQVTQQRSQHEPTPTQVDFWTKYWQAVQFGMCCRESVSKGLPQTQQQAAQMRLEGSSPHL